MIANWWLAVTVLKVFEVSFIAQTVDIHLADTVNKEAYQGFPTRMVYRCLRCTVLVGIPRYGDDRTGFSRTVLLHLPDHFVFDRREQATSLCCTSSAISLYEASFVGSGQALWCLQQPWELSDFFVYFQVSAISFQTKSKTTFAQSFKSDSLKFAAFSTASGTSHCLTEPSVVIVGFFSWFREMK